MKVTFSSHVNGGNVFRVYVYIRVTRTHSIVIHFLLVNRIMASESESNDLHGMVPDTHDVALVLIDVINHLDFEGNEGLINLIVF